jgi:S1-C subfamily serine protease
MRFNPEPGEPARQFPVPMDRWFVSDDLSVHAAVAPVNTDFLRENGVKRLAFFESDQNVANRAKARELGISEGDGVYVLGFPMGLVEGGERNFAIVKGGTVARISDCLAGVGNSFLIDSLIFPGNSGGPVVNRPEMGSVQGTKVQSAAYLIGMIEGYIPYEDYALSAQTLRPRVIFEENSGLAEVIPVDAVQQVIKIAIENLNRETKDLQ